jgi:hypothetical protein
MNERVIPMRGQLAIVASKSGGMLRLSEANNMSMGIGERCYVINRPAGNDDPR